MPIWYICRFIPGEAYYIPFVCTDIVIVKLDKGIGYKFKAYIRHYGQRSIELFSLLVSLISEGMPSLDPRGEFK